MTVNLERLALAPAGSSPEQISRQDAGARQQRWMQELERADLALRAKKTGRPAPAGLPHAAPLQPRAAGAAEVPPVLAGAAPTAPVQAAAPAIAADLARAHDPVPGTQSADGSDDGGAESAVRAKGAGSDFSAPSAGFAPAAVPIAGSPARAALGASQIAGPVAAAGTLPAGAPADVGATVDMPPAPPPAMRAGRAAPELPVAAAPAARADVPARGDAYGRQWLQLYRGDDGVHAWIRDAALSPAQVLAVAAGLSGELAQGGGQLAALSVNGKKIIARGAAPSAASDGAAEPAARGPITVTVVRGGA